MWRAQICSGNSGTETSLRFCVWNALACVEFLESRLDLGKEHESLDGVMERRVLGQLTEDLDEPIASELFRHDRILRELALVDRRPLDVATNPAPKAAARNFRDCKLFENRDFARVPQLPWRRGSSNPVAPTTFYGSFPVTWTSEFCRQAKFFASGDPRRWSALMYVRSSHRIRSFQQRNRIRIHL